VYGCSQQRVVRNIKDSREYNILGWYSSCGLDNSIIKQENFRTLQEELTG